MHAEEPSAVARAALEEARAIVHRELAGLPVEVYLFGSRATGRARVSSDLDIGVLPTGPLSSDTLARLRESFEDSTIPYQVDVVDLSRVTPAIREHVLREGQRWVG